MNLVVSPHVRRLIDLALDEDDVAFDVTSAAFFEHTGGEATLLAKQDLVVAGLDVVRAVYERLDPSIVWTFTTSDGARVSRGQTLGQAHGNAANLLRGERTALNFLQRMCGVATMTARYVDALGETQTRITDTRKTLPGWRLLDKYAVSCGGGANHRFSLAGGVMVKDNHIAAAGSVQNAVRRVREVAPHTVRIEVEVDTLAQLGEALDAGADVILLDNMDTETMREAVRQIRDGHGERVLVEASGNITLERLPQLRDLGLDFISSGALTHSVVAADISLEM